MELVEYKMFKDNKLVYRNTCPALFFIGIVPVLEVDLYDYIEIKYKGTITIYYADGIVNKWKQ